MLSIHISWKWDNKKNKGITISTSAIWIAMGRMAMAPIHRELETTRDKFSHIKYNVTYSKFY